MAGSISDRITELHHITMPVTDTALAERFYTEVLGAEVVRRMGSHFSIQFGGGPRFDVFQVREMPAGEPEHPKYAFTISADDLIECTRLLDRHGIGYDGPVHAGPPGAAQIYLDDPFGNHLELVCQGYADWESLRSGHDSSKLRYTWPRDEDTSSASAVDAAQPAPRPTAGRQVSGNMVTVSERGTYDIKTVESLVRPNQRIEILVNGKAICSYPNTGQKERRQSLGESQALDHGDQVSGRVIDQETGIAEAIGVAVAKIVER